MYVVKGNLNLSKYPTILKSKLLKVAKDGGQRLLVLRLGKRSVEVHQLVEDKETDADFLCKRDNLMTGGISKFLLAQGVFFS
jgi:hypothetical protein